MQAKSPLRNRKGAAFAVLWALLFLTLVCRAESAGVAPGKSAVQHIFQWRPFLGPFHSLVLHYPIGFLTMAFLLEVYGWRRPSAELRRVTHWVIWLSLLSGLMSATLGLMRAAGGEYDGAAVVLHRAFGMAVPLCTLLTLAAHWAANRKPGTAGWLGCYRGLLVLTLGLIVLAGHYGGNLTHGSRYLVQHAPEFVKEMLEEGPPQLAVAKAEPASEAARMFQEKVKPAFEAKCARCHGPEKQKGKYRLDQRDIALKGGESERPAIKPGEPLQSNLVRLILLPESDEDVMPPSGKERLSAEEIIEIIHWIEAGAVFPDAASDPDQTRASHGNPF